MSRFDNREKELEALSRGELIYCQKGNTCNINHCHLCNKKTDSPCCCAECCGQAAGNWGRHYYGHVLEKIVDQSCKFCGWNKNK